MLRLRLFGTPSIERDGLALSGRAAQRHRLALLALLALAPGRRLSRDKLIACLWPDSSAERGRNLLKVATYVLRTELGETALVSTGDELRLDTGGIDIDVVEFEQAVEQADHGRAVRLYAGPFLDGFFLGDSTEFERWVDLQRDRLAAGYRSALEALAGAAEAALDWTKAVEWWKTRAAHDPYDSRVALHLMRAFESSGNRAGALQHAVIHQRMLQEEFGVESVPDVAALAERLRHAPIVQATGAPPAVDATPVAATPAAATPAAATPAAPAISTVTEPAAPAEPSETSPTHVPDTVAAEKPARGRAGRRRWIIAAPLAAVLAAALIAALAAAGMWTLWPARADTTSSIVVLPFVNLSANEDYEYFSDGLTEEIITRLAAVPGLKVISRTSAMHYKGTTRALPEIAAELGVDHVLEGSVRQEAGRVRISAQLVDARNDAHVWAENYEYELVDGFRVQEQLAHEVAQALELRLARRVRRLLVRQGTSDPEAYELYERGRYLWNTRTRAGHERAIEYYEQAIARDSSYGDAYGALAHAYLTGFQLDLLGMSDAEAYERVKWASERALALDEESADAHVAVALALLWQRNWPGSEREYQRAIELNPGHATARSWYSLLLRGMDRQQDALNEARRAVELDPFGIISLHNYGWQCYIMRDMECALEQLGRSAEIGSYPGASRGLGVVYASLGMHEEARRAVEQAIARAPHRTDFIADLAYVHALAGDTAQAYRLLEQAKTNQFEPFSVARAFVALEQTDSAFAWLGRSNLHWPHRGALADPVLDPLRADPRFALLAARVRREMGLQQD